MNLTITPRIQTSNKSNKSYGNTSFGLKADKETIKLINKSDISFLLKSAFHDLLHDKSTDHLTLTIKENTNKGYSKYIAALKDSKYPYAKAINDGFFYGNESQPVIKTIGDYIPIKGENNLEKLVRNIIFPNEHESAQENLEYLSDCWLKPIHEKFISKIVGLPALNKPKQ